MLRFAKAAIYILGLFTGLFVLLFAFLVVVGSFVTLTFWTPLDDMAARYLIVAIVTMLSPFLVGLGCSLADGA